MEKEVAGSLMAYKGATAAEETGGEWMIVNDTERVEEMAEPMEKDETAVTKDKGDTAKGNWKFE